MILPENIFISQNLILPPRTDTYEVTLATLHSNQMCLLVHRDFCYKVMLSDISWRRFPRNPPLAATMCHPQISPGAVASFGASRAEDCISVSSSSSH